MYILQIGIRIQDILARATASVIGGAGKGGGEAGEDVTTETQEDKQLGKKNQLSAACGQRKTSIRQEAEEEERNKREPQPGPPDGATTGKRDQDRHPHQKGQRKQQHTPDEGPHKHKTARATGQDTASNRRNRDRTPPPHKAKTKRGTKRKGPQEKKTPQTHTTARRAAV